MDKYELVINVNDAHIQCSEFLKQVASQENAEIDTFLFERCILDTLLKMYEDQNLIPNDECRSKLKDFVNDVQEIPKKIKYKDLSFVLEEFDSIIINGNGIDHCMVYTYK